MSLITLGNGVAVESDFIANAGKLSLGGRFALSGQLRYRPEDRTVVVKEVRLDALQFQNGMDVPEWAKSRIEPMVVQTIEKNALYRFPPGELVALGIQLEVEAIEVVQEGILLKLRPVR